MPQLIDLVEVNEAMERFRASQKEKAEHPEMGCVFRAQLAVIPELTLWRAREMNRGTEPNELLNAFVMLVASALAGELLANTTDTGEAFQTLNRSLAAIAEETAALLINPASRGTLTRFSTKEAGTA